ncbi:MAG: hypothetical protein Q8P11_03600 [bacterium]|nr:hypothetical protein [bacterium]
MVEKPKSKYHSALGIQTALLEKGMKVFTPLDFQRLFQMTPKNASMTILRNTKRGLFQKLKNSAYVLNIGYISLYRIANMLYRPSYISLEIALSRYRMIPETVYAVTSVTTKATRHFYTPRGHLTYQKIPRRAFTGYSLMTVEGERVYYAEPAKALVDYLYFVSLGHVSLNDRLDTKSVSKAEALVYAELFRRPSLTHLINTLYDSA